MALLDRFSFTYMAPAGDADGGGSDSVAEAIARGDYVGEDAPAADQEGGKDADDLNVVEAEDQSNEADEAEEGDKKAKRKDDRIPLNRHKEILAKERAQKEAERAKSEALQQELAQYKKGKEFAELNTEIGKMEDAVATLEKEYTRLLADGELDKAAEKMAEIRKTERQITETKSDMKIQAAEARATERARYNIVLERIESSFPTLNPDHELFDQSLMDEVADLKDAYQARGMTPTAALQKAVKVLVGAETTKQENATSATPRVSEKDIAAERRREAVKKTAETAGKQPPSLGKVGLDGDKLGGGALDAAAVMKMSQREFAALNEETLSKMRGDTL